MDVLVLNAAYQPIRFCSWEDAMTKLHAVKASERVEIVSTYPDRFIRSAHVNHPMPSVVRHVRSLPHKKRNIRFGRETVWARDKGRCAYCGMQVPRNSYTYDHVIPRVQGGKTDFTNVVAACSPCNARKAGRTPQQAGMKLRVVPHQPTSLSDEFRYGLKYMKWMPSEWKAWFPNSAEE